ncbi:ATP-dependent DNA helicase Q4 isoform X2 [Dendropsophus ebraccatus]|uniref:ATP-dependent DNA helicase Q4 isoform X2 n=1 Tax=Dendropsophus ebraccatus TaxID=150705 RepID=UPI003831FDB4
MERYEEVKRLLKTWEAEFLKEQKRKPTKADMEASSMEIQGLYREFRTLKQGRLGVTPTLCGPESPQWGSHLNRDSVTTKLTSAERGSLMASAQYYGMKLKANLGGASKNRPVSLKKSSASPRTPTPDPSSTGTHKRGSPPAIVALDVSPESSPGFPDDFMNTPPGLQPHVLRLTPSSQDQKKLNQLQAKVGQRLTSLNPAWLERCERRLGREQCPFIGSGDPCVETPKPSNTTGPSLLPGQRRSPDLGGLPLYTKQREIDPAPEFSYQSWPQAALPVAVQDASHEVEKPVQDASHEVEKPVQDAIHEVEKPVQDASHEVEKPVQDASHEVEKPVQDASHEVEKPVQDASHEVEKPVQDASHEVEKPVQDASHEVEKPVQDASHEVEKPVQDASREVKKLIKRSCVQSQGKSRAEPREEAVCREQATATEVMKTGNSRTSRSTGVGRRKGKRLRDNLTDSESEESNGCAHKSNKRTSKKAKTEEDKTEEGPLRIPARGAENLLGEVMEEEEASVQRVTTKSYRAPQKPANNFVRINLKKKSYVKGFALNGNRLRKQMWKQKWQKKGEQFGGGGRPVSRSEDVCFRCGQCGHWASQCPGNGVAVPLPLKSDAIPEEEELVLPTLEEVARMTNTRLIPTCDIRNNPQQLNPDPVMAVDVIKPMHEPAPPPPAMQPLYDLTASGRVCETPPEVYAALRELGYQKFRPGQEEAVMRILSGLSSLVILSTGMGKSLCYQLPAYMYAMRSRCITLVISPLVSLMDDQVSGLPSKLKAVCVHSNMTRAQREAAMDKVKQGKVHVVLLSPEALVGGGQSGTSCLPPADQLPPVAFACIDEVHCVSEWSHNFRPCYLRLCKVLRERLGVSCLLGLTATATLSTAQDVARHLEIPDDGDVPVRLAAVPPNLHLSVSMDRDRDQALVTLLKEERFGSLDSIIIYCTRREETQRLSAMLRTCLQGVTVIKTRADDEVLGSPDRKKLEARKKIRRPLKWMADSYHAGLSSAERRRVQNNFMSGQLRIVVATVAFGMGLDKSDVRGIIHYNMPKNFESYVQEIGRAGRDGKDAHCHLFLDPECRDLDELRRHVYADSVDYFIVKKLVQRVFPDCRCRELHSKRTALSMGHEVDDSEMMDFLEQCDGGERRCVAAPEELLERICHRHERALPIEETVQALDVREESIETLLCYLELHERRWLHLLHPTLSTCRVTCYSGPQQLRGLAHRCPPVAVALARERLAGVDHTHVSSVEFNAVELADSMGWEVIPVKRALRDLQWNSSAAGGFRGTGRSGVLVEFSKLSFHFRSYGDLTNEELEEVCDFLHQKVTSREATALRQLKSCYRVFHSVSYRSSGACAERVNPERSAQLKTLILHYFQGNNPLDETDEDHPADSLSQEKVEDWKTQVCSDVRHFLSIHQEERFSGRAIARIFHGIDERTSRISCFV